LAVLRLITKLELGRPHDRQVGGFGTLENSPGIDADLAIAFGQGKDSHARIVAGFGSSAAP
jgi:hypothetical protein